MDSMKVLFGEDEVGTLLKNDYGDLEFEYSQEWQVLGQNIPISLSLPLSKQIDQKKAKYFFGNLLPEGLARENICRKHRIAFDDDYELLKLIGSECAGVLRIIEEGSASYSTEAENVYNLQELRKIAKTGVVQSKSSENLVQRFSLAGAQNKLAGIYVSEHLRIPISGVPSTHFVKFDRLPYKHVSWNEAYTTYIARRLGYEVVEIQPQDGFSIIKRYDREVDLKTKQVQRLHQEDFCQILGISSKNKYQNDGGPSLARVAEVVRKYSSDPLRDIDRLIRHTVYNVLSGNSDGHSKNLSLIYGKDFKSKRIAPFYDLVCTRVYAGVPREMAFSIGNQYDPDKVTTKNWQDQAVMMKVDRNAFLKVLATTDQALRAHLKKWTSEFQEKFGSQPLIEQIKKQFEQNLHRIRN